MGGDGARCIIIPTDAKVASVVTVNRYSVTVFCYLTTSPSPRHFRPKMAQCLCIFIFRSIRYICYFLLFA